MRRYKGQKEHILVDVITNLQGRSDERYNNGGMSLGKGEGETCHKQDERPTGKPMNWDEVEKEQH